MSNEHAMTTSIKQGGKTTPSCSKLHVELFWLAASLLVVAPGDADVSEAAARGLHYEGVAGFEVGHGGPVEG